MSINNGGEFVVNGVNQVCVGDGDDSDAADANVEVADNVDEAEDCSDGDGDNRNIEIVNGATKKKLKCCLTNVNELCFVNIQMKQRELLEKANPYITRFRKGKQTNAWVNFTSWFMMNACPKMVMI